MESAHGLFSIRRQRVSISVRSFHFDSGHSFWFRSTIQDFLGLVKFTFGSERVKLPCSIFLHNAPCRAFGGRHLQPRQRLNSSRGNFSEFVLVFRKNKTSMELYLDQSSVDISGISQQFVCCDFWPSQLWETYEILYRFLLVKLNSFDMLSLGMSMCFNPILFDERPFQLWTSGGGGGGRG